MDVDENHLESDIPNYFISNPTSENTCSHNNTTQVSDRLVDYNSDNFSLYSISPANSRNSKQEEGSSPYSHSLFLDDIITENSSTGNKDVIPLNLTSKQGKRGTGIHSSIWVQDKENELARNLLLFHKQKKSYF